MAKRGRPKRFLEPLKQSGYRDTEEVLAAMRAQAAQRGRSMNDEIRLASRAWLRQALLAQLADPTGRAEAEAAGHDVDADEAATRAGLDEMYEKAFEIPDGTELREVVMNGGDRLH